MNISDNQFDDIRPLNDNEVAEAIAQLLVDERFKKAAEQIVKPYTWEQFASLLSSCKTKFEKVDTVETKINNKCEERTAKAMGTLLKAGNLGKQNPGSIKGTK
jgi:ribosomal protein L29